MRIKKSIKGIIADDNKVIFTFVILLTAAMFFLLNCLTPLNNADDQKYKYIIGIEDTVRVLSLNDIICSQINHYYNWGGRCIVHSIAQFFLMYDKMVFNIANTIVVTLLLADIYLLTVGKKISIKMWIVACCMVWFSVPGVGNLLWLTGSCNYLWGTTIEIFFLTLYILDLRNQKKIFKVDNTDIKKECKKTKNILLNITKTVFFFIFGLVAGWTLEAGGIAMIIGLIIIVLYKAKIQCPIKANQISGLLGAIIGYSIMIVAPGNFIRMNTIESSVLNRSFTEAMFHRFGRESYGLVLHLGIVVSTYVILMAMYYVENKNMCLKELIINQSTSIFYVILALVSVYAMTASPSYAMRVLVTPAFYMIAAVLSAWCKISNKDFKCVLSVSVVCMMTIVMLHYSTAVWAVNKADSDAIINIHIEYFGYGYFD